MKTNKLIFFTLIFLLILLAWSPKAFAGTQEWNALNYDVNVLPNGDMEVVETWDVYISETNTLFKDFNVDYEKYSGIKDVRVSRVKDGSEMFLEQIYEEQYHVDSGCYYGLYINNGKQFEIAWNVGLDNSSATRTYKIYYTVKDAVKVYNDCTELYWQFVGKENTMGGDNITGTIKLPRPVSDMEKLRVWAHGPLNGDIQKESADTVVFEVPSFSGGMIEVRVVTEENIYSIYNKTNHDELESIIAEETEWADKANKQRERQKMAVGAGLLAGLGANIGLTILFIKKAFKYVKEGKEIDKKLFTEDLKYFRDIPGEAYATPAVSSYLYNYKGVSSNIYMYKVFPATMLDLSIKGCIEFRPVADKNDIMIIVKRDVEVDLSKDERIIYSLLIKCCDSCQKDEITSKEFSKYTKKRYESIHTDFENIEKAAKETHKMQGNIDSKREDLYNEWNSRWSAYFVTVFVLIMFTVLVIFIAPIFIALIICSIICLINRNKIKTALTDKGYREQQEWKALKNYLNDYSLLKEKAVPDIILWEKYLVYATVFGISAKVLKQLKVDFPQFFEEGYSGSYGRYSYFTMFSDSRYDSFSVFERALSTPYTTASNAYNSAHYSSGSGGGGGFSGGGGGRWRRRPVAVVVKNIKNTCIIITVFV